MSDVTMRHPTLPADQEIEVAKDAVPHYTGAGWQIVPAEELQRRADEKAKAAAKAAAAEESAGSETADEPEQSEPAEASTERPARSRAKAPEKKGE